MGATVLSRLCLCEVPFVNVYRAEKEDYPMKNPGRHHCGMLYTIDGSEIFSFKNTTIRTYPDSVLVIPKGESYTINLEGEKSLVITIDFEISDECDFSPFLIKLDKNNSVKGLFSDIEKEWKRKAAQSNTMCKSYFYKISALLIQKQNSYYNSKSKEQMQKAVDYLHENYLKQGFRVDILPEICGTSRRYFEKLFYGIYNVSPKEYIINMKLSLAKELLLNEKSSVTDIAINLGFSDVYHFSKTFKAKTGYSPVEYKKSLAG